MPYIKPEKRNRITPEKGAYNGTIVMEEIACAGDLNYAFTMLAIDYIKYNGLSYQSINDIVGALDGAKAEFQRRIVVDYENSKIESNGDVYPSLKTPKYPGVGEFNGS